MSLRTMQVNSLFSSPVENTKDKVLSMRVEDSMYMLLEDLAKELQTETVSQTARKILRFYLLNAIFEEEWSKVHSPDFNSFVEEVAEAGNTIELQKYRNLLAELSKYVELMRAILDRLNISAEFFEVELSKLEEVTGKLEKVEILWRAGVEKEKK